MPLESRGVCVVGSINMDLAVGTSKMPVQGETVIGGEFATYYGGKGANQAVAAARMGTNVHMIGAVGADPFGTEIRTHLDDEGIMTDGIEVIPDKATGVANIILSEQDNRIIVASGANKSVTPALIDRHEAVIGQSDIVLLQLEIPLDTVVHTVDLARKYNVPVVLNPAPYQTLPITLPEGVTYLTPNEIELDEMKRDMEYGIIKHKVVVTKGKHGIHYYEETEEKVVPGHQVDVQDTTGAGDTFNGVLAAMLAQKESLPAAIRYANAAAALSVTKIGAQSGMPTYEELQDFMNKMNANKAYTDTSLHTRKD